MTWHVKVQLELGGFDLDVDISGDARPVAIIGPNGSGKSTLLRVVAGALTPSRGEIVVDSVALYASKRGIDLSPQERRVAYVPQGYGLFPHLSAIQNVNFGIGDLDRARRMLDDLGAGSLSEQQPAELSGGEQQRVALARALVTRPQILLLDEPLAALDVQSRRETRTVLADLVQEHHGAALVVTHDVRDVVALNADVCVLSGGRVVQRGTLSELADAPATPFVEEFVGLR